MGGGIRVAFLSVHGDMGLERHLGRAPCWLPVFLCHFGLHFHTHADSNADMSSIVCSFVSSCSGVGQGSSTRTPQREIYKLSESLLDSVLRFVCCGGEGRGLPRSYLSPHPTLTSLHKQTSVA